MDRPINILVLAGNIEGGVAYYRSTKPHAYLARKYENDFNIDIDTSLPNYDLDSYLAKYDIIHFHKSIYSDTSVIKLCKRLGIITVCDIDDYWMLGSHHPMNAVHMAEKRYQNTVDHLINSDYVTTTTEIFADKIRTLNKNVVVLPNAIDVNERQFVPTNEKHDKIRIGIICGSTHRDDIALLNSVVAQLKPDVLDKIQFVLCGFDTRGNTTTINKETKEKTVVPTEPRNSVWAEYERILTDNYKICSQPYATYLKMYTQLPYAGSEKDEKYLRRWTKTIHNYATHYNDIDILLAPLVESDFNMYKSQLKAIEAGVFSKALIAQKFGPYTIDLTSSDKGNGEIDYNANALLVDSRKNHKNWAKYISLLVNDEKLRTSLSNNLHDTITSKYTLDIVSDTRAEFYKKIFEACKKN